MAKFFIGFVIGLLFAGLVCVILVFAAIRLGGSNKPQVASNSALILHLEGDFPEQPSVDVPIPLLQEQQPITTLETWRMLQGAASDSKIKALVLEPRGVSA